MLVKLTSGLNFINVLCTAFTWVEPKRVKKTVKLSVFLRFWDLHVQKLHVNMLVKLKPGLNFINVLQAALVCTDQQKRLHFWDLRVFLLLVYC